jgi:hypothetical protein
MQLIHPYVEVPGDRADRIMARACNLVGFDRTKAVWCFGFLADSDAAKAYGVQSETFIFVLADHGGEVIDTFTGFAFNLPSQFKDVINAKNVFKR